MKLSTIRATIASLALAVFVFAFPAFGAWDAPVLVATTGPVAHSGLLKIDGINLGVGARVLDKDHADATLRGIWTVSTGAWSRATDADTDPEVVSGNTVSVQWGATNRGKIFALTTADPITVGVTGLTFADVTPPPGDISSVGVTAPITGGGTSGAVTIGVATMTGDSGAGGARGVVPAPAAGDAAASKFLKADGNWTAVTTPTFATLTGGTNTGAAMLVGTGASLGATGTGTIDPVMSAAHALTWTGRSKGASPSNGVVTFTDNAGTAGCGVVFGPQTSDFPALFPGAASRLFLYKGAAVNGFADIGVASVGLYDNAKLGSNGFVEFSNGADNPFTTMDTRLGRAGVATLAVLDGAGTGAGKLSFGPSGSITISTGSGAPAGACVTGSLYLRTDGGAGSTLYVCEATAWAAK